MSEEGSRLPGELLRKVLERVLTWRIFDSVVIPALADLQHEDTLMRSAPAWRRALVLTRGYLGIWSALGLCLASWPARSLRQDWLGGDAAGPSLIEALAPRAGILGLVFTLLLGAQWRGLRHRLTGDAWVLFLALPSVMTVTVPVAFFLGLVLAVSWLSVRSPPKARTLWLGPAVGLSIASGLFTFGLYACVTPQANQSYRERVVRLLRDSGSEGMLPIQKGTRELTLGELQTRIREGRKEGKSTVALDIEWHKKWAIPAACLVFGPLAIGLHGLWKRPRPAMTLALACAATLLLYVALRIGEETALSGQVGPLPAIWAGDALLALVTSWLIARLPRLREGATIPA
jgi:hypothetical protein